ncbi:hypothetical protein [Galbitalea soli]|uniref:Uncharacterized protein n=1 Tax=Galbitalea soli TaxID=1268042 RepID=A0A7C9PND9_9MICO|nr:hypothetical protein [Galbitalea soli]NEM91348.1 hypothetical protein [Galbitalea soli]NYJ30038.1 hypothetical protein [Galbitalea soli]
MNGSRPVIPPRTERRLRAARRWALRGKAPLYGRRVSAPVAARRLARRVARLPVVGLLAGALRRVRP